MMVAVDICYLFFGIDIINIHNDNVLIICL